MIVTKNVTSSPTERHHQIQLIRILKRKLQGNDEGVIDEGEDGPLSENVGDFPRALSDMSFADSFERIDALCIFLADLHHLAEAALANDFEQVEGLYGERLVASRFEVNFEMK